MFLVFYFVGCTKDFIRISIQSRKSMTRMGWLNPVIHEKVLLMDEGRESLYLKKGIWSTPLFN